MRSSVYPLSAFVAFALIGCGSANSEGTPGAGGGGGSESNGGGGGTSAQGGGGGADTGTTGQGGNGGSIATGGTAGSGGALVCDTIASCGNMGEGCVGCAVAGACAAQFSACFDLDDCSAYGACISGCAEDPTCIGNCDTAHPEGKPLYEAFFACVICQECPVSCAAPATCTTP